MRCRLLFGRLSAHGEGTLSIGGFGFEYEPAYYEDVDLCLKLALHFGRVIVEPRARVTHLESHTTTDRALQLHDTVELNRHKFVNVWGDWAGSAPGVRDGGRRHLRTTHGAVGNGTPLVSGPGNVKRGADGGALLPLRAGAGGR